MIDPMTWFRQAAFRWSDAERVVYVDPWGTPADSPTADLILITHAHFDHFQPDEIERLRRRDTRIAAPRDVADELSGDVTPVSPGEHHELAAISFTTVPAYNTREEALGFHPKAKRWVGYVFEFSGASYYHAGDTDHAPELNDIRADVALVPIGGHFTMDANAAGGLVREIGPRLAVPMHFGYVVGSPSDAERFRASADPVPVELMTPVEPFERP